jgi:hypothetical protein
MPPHARVGLVLHELARVYNFAIGEPKHHTVIDVTGKAQQRCEELADFTVRDEWELEFIENKLADWEDEQT